MKGTLLYALCASIMLQTHGHAITAKELLIEMANDPDPVNDKARLVLKYPALSGETETETAARRNLLVLRDRLQAEGKLTPALEIEVQKGLATIAAGVSARQAAEAQRVIVIQR